MQAQHNDSSSSTHPDRSADRPQTRIGAPVPSTGEGITNLANTDLSEKGRTATGEVISADRRLYMQFLAFGDAPEPGPLIEALETPTAAGDHIQGALYADINDPRGVGLVTFSESADYFLDTTRALLNQPPFGQLTPKPEYTMFGRTYSIGYEQDLDATLITRPRDRICDPGLPWAIWYPLRRAGSFEQLSSQEQNTILAEHGGIGRAFGRAHLGYDIRLACYGLDKHDNDFVVALLGPELYPLSVIVQRMRKTKQTSLHLERLGPFFIGKAIWQSRSGT